jgi:enolase
MIIKRLRARKIKDTRGDKTIEVVLKTDFGKFVASSPNGKSRGKFEAKPWKKSLASDIEVVNGADVGDLEIESFSDLAVLEKIFKKKVGANTMIAIEYVFLRALARVKGKEVWEVIGSKSSKMPRPVGNVIGGGSHSGNKLRADFQEFHVIPMSSSIERNVRILLRAHKNARRILKNVDSGFRGKENDESAWQCSLSNKNVMEVIIDVKNNVQNEFHEKVDVGLDVAASQFFSRGKYRYKNEKKVRDVKEQVEFMSEVARRFFYIEDPLDENDFAGFSKIKSKGLIVGDDLTVTNLSRIKKAVKQKSVNAVILKPNQNGSLIALKKIVEYCRREKIKMIFSHRSGETSDNILADLAFGFGADFIKTGVTGRGRREKLKRLVEIERSLM